MEQLKFYSMDFRIILPTKDERGELGHDSDRKEDIELERNIIKQVFEVNSKFFVPPSQDILNENLVAIIESGLLPISRNIF